VLEGGAQLGATAVDAAADSAQLDAERGRDLLVGQPLDVAEHNCRSEIGGQRVQSLLDIAVEMVVVVGLGRGRLAPRQPVGGVLGERVEADALLAAHLVEEQVRRDAVQPALEGARSVGRERPEDAYEDVLGEVLGVVGVAREAVGQPVDAGGVRAHDLVPAGRGPVSLDRTIGLVGALRRIGRRSRHGGPSSLPTAVSQTGVVENSYSTHGARHPFQPTTHPA
jgi:hypothetical protein